VPDCCVPLGWKVAGQRFARDNGTKRTSSALYSGTSGLHATGGGSGGLPALPPLNGNGGGLQYMLNGQVSAISATSITLSGSGPSVTAAITSSTQVGGNVTSVSQIKVGDQVTAQVGGKSATALVAMSIQDPGQ